MRVSRNKILAPLIAVLAAGSVPLGPVVAQLGPPVRLVPLPAPATPATGSPAPAGIAAPAAPSSIQATPLAPVDTAWSGTLAASGGALPQTMWQGTTRSFVVAALPQLQSTTSPTLQDLARRLLLSDALAPMGEDPADGPGLAMLRLQRLVALGRIDDALAIINQVRWRGNTETLDRLKVQLRFLNNDSEGGCRQVQEAIGRYQDVWWDRALIACEALAGDQAKASLGLNLLRERKEPRDQLFDSLVDAVGGRSAKIDRMPDPTAIRVTLLAAAKLPLPAEALQSADPAVLRAWATNANVPADRRLSAAERAAELGALSLQELGDIDAAITFKPEERKPALAQASDSPRARALLYAMATQEASPALRAEALQALLQAARKRGVFPFTARLVAPLLLELGATPDLDWFAPDAVRAFYAADRPAEARLWLQLADPATSAALLPLARLAQGANAPAWPAAGLRPALDALQPKEGAEPAKLLLAAALLAAVGEPVTQADWATLVGVPPSPSAPLPNAALVLDQREAAADRRLGETVLATLIMARAGERPTTEPIIIAQAVAGLRAIGLEAEARRLAVEAAIAGGV